MKAIHVIGAGLAGLEAAWQIAEQGHPAQLHEMRPQRQSSAHQTDLFAELVCSNSLRAAELTPMQLGFLKKKCVSLSP